MCTKVSKGSFVSTFSLEVSASRYSSKVRLVAEINYSVLLLFLNILDGNNFRPRNFLIVRSVHVH
jgi:hypothetical protein